MLGQVSLRPVTPADAGFLRLLHLDSHPELRQLPLPQVAADQLVQLQLDAQLAQYRTSFPHALDQLIETDDAAVGRCWISLSATELRLLDIAVLSTHRGNGIGRTVLTGLCQRGDATGVPVTLSVWSDNAGAQRLYRRLGFEAGIQSHGYLQMSRTPATAADAAEGA
ncbi:MAG: GNAT family N-acetyltransferase [Jatrophihabitans sp.]